MAVATTVIAPPLIKYFFAEDKDQDGIMDDFEVKDITGDYSRIG
jgi:hypothetical protein